MKFVDINTFYCPGGGGIRTYHEAKFQYFSRHPEHQYFLICPGAARRTTALHANVFLEEFYGMPAGRSPDGYRLLLNYVPVFSLVRRLRPDVLEAGDPWLTGLFCLFTPFLPAKMVRSSFYHSDPVDTYFFPWAVRSGAGWKHKAASAAGAMFYRLQKKYHATLVSSQAMHGKLETRGVPRIMYTPFGVDPVFFQKGRERTPRPKGASGPVRMLYAGRLDGEKGMDVLAKTLTRLAAREDVAITIAGRGKWAEYFRNLGFSRVVFTGYMASKEDMAALYLRHDVFLFPGPSETFGLGALEALAVGLVVIGPDSGGAREVVSRAGEGFIFKAGDPEDFYMKICSSIECDFEIASERSVRAAEAYGDWDAAIGRMTDCYGRLVHEAQQ